MDEIFSLRNGTLKIPLIKITKTYGILNKS